MSVVFAHAPYVLIGGALHEPCELRALLKATGLVVQSPYLLRVLQRVVHVFQVVAGLHVLPGKFLHDAGESRCLATEGMVEIVGIERALKLKYGAYQRAHGARFATRDAAQAWVVLAIVQSGHLFPVPTVAVGLLAVGGWMAAPDDEARRARRGGIDISGV